MPQPTVAGTTPSEVRPPSHPTKRTRREQEQEQEQEQDVPKSDLDLTGEQQAVIEAALRGDNVSVRAVPGAGKTACTMVLMEELHKNGRRLVYLTYSKDMKMEARAKAENKGMHQTVYNFHAWAKRLWKLDGQPLDDDLRDCLRAGKPMVVHQAIDVVLIDEAQDVTELHMRMLEEYVRRTGPLQIIIVGDERQCVNTFGLVADSVASPKFLTDAEVETRRVTDAARPWCHLRLTISFRLTRELATFVNRCCGLEREAQIVGVGKPVVKVNEDERAVHYYCNNMRNCDWGAARLYKYIQRFGAGNVMIIAPNNFQKERESQTHANQILNRLHQRYGVIIMNSSEKGTGSVVVLHTYFSCKGLERICTIVLGADSFAGWITMQQRFVAMTRASGMLVLFHHYENATMDGRTSLEHVRECGAQVMQEYEINYKRKAPRPKPVTVTELIEGGLGSTLRAAVDDAQWVPLQTVREPLTIPPPPVIQIGDSTYEPDVNDMYGVAVAMMVERQKRVPRLYQRIFNPIIVSSSAAIFANPVLHEIEISHPKESKEYRDLAQTAEDVRVFYTQVKSKDQKQKDDALAGLAELGLPSAPSEEGFLTFLKTRVCPELVDRLIEASRYRLQFPIEHREALLGDVPLEGDWTAAQCMQAACAAQAYNGQHHRLRQIDHFDWVDGPLLRKAAGRLSECMPHWVEAELTMCSLFKDAVCAVEGGRPMPFSGIVGRADFVAGGRCIVETKCKRTLTATDKAQLLLYMHLGRIDDFFGGAGIATTTMKGRLINTLTNEALAITQTCTAYDSQLFLARVCQEQLQLATPPEFALVGGLSTPLVS